MRSASFLLCLATLTLLTSPSFAEDMVEFLSGSKVLGKVLAIRKEAKEFDFEATISGRTVKRTYAYDKVKAVTINGKRYVLTAKTESASVGRRGPSRQTAGDSSGS